MDRIDAGHAKLVQALRYGLAMASRRLGQRGIDRATSLLDRAIGRRLQRIDELDYRLREGMRARIEESRRRERALESRLRYFDVRPRLASDRRRLDAAESKAGQIVRLQLARRIGTLDGLAGNLSQLSPLRNSAARLRDCQQGRGRDCEAECRSPTRDAGLRSCWRRAGWARKSIAPNRAGR